MDTVCFNSEKFFRLASDYLLYEGEIELAKKYVNKALKFDNEHFKSLLLKGQIFLIENKIKLSEKYLLKAYTINPENEKCLSYLACLFDMKGKYGLALEYLNKIFKNKIEDKEFLSECYRLKISLLINLNQHKKAKNTLKALNNKLYSNDVFDIGETFKDLLNPKLEETLRGERYGSKKDNARILHVNF